MCCWQFLESPETTPANAADYFACYGLTGESACLAANCGYSTTVAEGEDVTVKIASINLTLPVAAQTPCVPGAPQVT